MCQTEIKETNISQNYRSSLLIVIFPFGLLFLSQMKDLNYYQKENNSEY